MAKKLTKEELEKRTKERRVKLIELCRYYKDDFENPWQYCYNPTLVWRKDMWELEKQWVDALSKSYRCDMAKHDYLDTLYLTEFMKGHRVPLSLINHIFLWANKQSKSEGKLFSSVDAVNLYAKYMRYTPLARDYRMYFAYYMGDDIEPEGINTKEGSSYIQMGYSQERIMQNGDHDSFSSWHYGKMAEEHRGKEGIWGWYADPKFPSKQKDVVFFMCCNWGTWCPCDDVDAMAEEYLYYHYPGDDYLKRTLFGESPMEDFQYHIEFEDSAIEEGKKVFHKEIDVDRFLEFEDCCYFKINDSEESFPDPILITVEYETNKATILSHEESKSFCYKVKVDEKKNYIDKCLIFKGEENNPYDREDWKYYQWDLEQTWVMVVAGQTIRENNYIGEFLADFPDALPFDIRPLSYKAFAYSYLTSWNIYPPDKDDYRNGAMEVYEKLVEYNKANK